MERPIFLVGFALTILSVDVQSAPLYRITDLSLEIPFVVEEMVVNNVGQFAGLGPLGRWSNALLRPADEVIR